MPSELDRVRHVIEDRWQDRWDSAAVPTAYEGVDFEPPDGAWCRLTVRFGDAFEETMGPDDGGTRSSELVGVVIVQLFAKPGEGTGDLIVLADAARDVFNMQDLDGVEFGPSSGPGSPEDARGGWLGVSVRTPFTAHELT